MSKKTKVINLTGETPRINFDIRGMEKLVLLPDISPSRGKLPVGSVAVYPSDHLVSSEYLGSDVGCGMTLAKFKRKPENDPDYLAYATTNELARIPRDKAGGLGGGNHFITFYEVQDLAEEEAIKLGLNVGDNVFLVHTGSRSKGRELYEKGLTGLKYLAGYDQVLQWAKKNRRDLTQIVSKVAGAPVDLLLDRMHNTLDVQEERIIYRKGAVNLNFGELTVVPSSMAGEAVLIKAKPEINEIENSMIHGTGRRYSRAEAKTKNLSFEEIRKKIYLPSTAPDDWIRTEHPDCYRTLDGVLPFVEKYMEIVGVLKPKAAVL
jgi:RNA-splicing ligase RtcB